ncbi:hypothetical protein PIROE2DRAFT_14538 [Piromyces sp. E2]|nr:hypothetical protein PIROE2DRAFT_14538 [Piromyces sp. E2]|eukprot:OUM59837.1 hypothetical protein PIROE2DRAFT_14538 [Piromyces sp. E2]
MMIFSNFTKENLAPNVNTLPTSFGYMDYLVKINLSGCDLIGRIPDDIGNLKNLTSINLSNNQLYGNIPSSIGNLSKLTEIEVQNNKLDGYIPGSVHKLTNIKKIHFENNKYLHGKAPVNEGLEECNYSGTMLCVTNDINDKCTYPEVKYNCYVLNEDNTPTCNVVNSKYNRDDQFCKCDDQFIGSGYTECLNDCQYINVMLNWNITDNCCSKQGFSCSKSTLTEIDLSRYNINGTIPETIGFLNKLKFLYLHYNNLEGSLPSTMSNLTSLVILDISNNKLSGNIPTFLDKLPNLKRIDLSDNQLDGSIPLSLTKLTNLTQIDLSGNNLSGSIPNELTTLPKLEYL